MENRADKHVTWKLVAFFATSASWLVTQSQVLAKTGEIVVSEETTIITGPIAWDGLPDYPAYIRARMRDGVTAANNGAIPFWNAFGSSAVEPQLRESFFDDLGIADPDEKDTLDLRQSSKLASDLENWFIERGFSQSKTTVGPLLDQLMRRRWAPADCPPVAAWIERNNRRIDLLASTPDKARFYSPRLAPPDDPARPAMLYSLLSPDVRLLQVAVKLLVTCAMHDLGNGDQLAAWKNLSSARGMIAVAERTNLGALSTVIAASCEDVVAKATLSWLSSTADQTKAANLLRVLSSADDRSSKLLADLEYDHLSLADAAVACLASSRHGEDASNLVKIAAAGEPAACFRELRNHRIRESEIAKMGNRVDRRQAAEDNEARFIATLEVRNALQKTNPKLFFTPKSLGTSAGMLIQAEAGVHLTGLLVADDHLCAQQRLTLLATALKLHQLRHGEYPDTLDALAPDPLAEIPLDPFTNKPFVYERRDEGFAIWSRGRNGVDDNGSDQSGEFVDGEYAPIDWTGERPKPDGPDDVVVRLPVPVLELPGDLE